VERLVLVASIKKLVEERGVAYGPPAVNHVRTARLWTAYLSNRGHFGRLIITPEDVCFLNILQKIARCMGDAGPSRDSLEDIQGYAENLLTLIDIATQEGSGEV